VSSSTEISESTFQHMKLSAPLREAVEAAGYREATPIQARAIPLLLEGRDVLGQAQTGTGKTAAFALPMLESIDLTKNVTQVIVLTPTRELAIQVAQSFKRYAAGLAGFRVAAIYGGQDYQVQFRQLDRGAHVVVGTPGRVLDHMRRGSLKLDSVRGLVLDEADEMLRMGFAEDVDTVLTQTPAERQIALFSATMPDAIRRIAHRHLRNPAEIIIRQKTATAETIRQRFVMAAPHDKAQVLGRILEAEPIDGVIVFVNTKSTTEPLAEYLSSQGHRTAALSSDVVQAQRERIIQNLRAGKVDVIIATDVAARGLDVDRISHVINYDFPSDSESYVHRIGRTGRAGREGHAILFLHPRGRHLLKRIEQATRKTIEPMEIPSNEIINERRALRFHERISGALEHPDFDRFAALVKGFQENHGIEPDRIAAAITALVSTTSPLFLDDELPVVFEPEPRDRRGGRQFEREFGGRPSRFDGPPARDEFPRGERRAFAPSETYRIEVGHAHNVKPTNIVGAIANETGLESRFIGRINIFDEHSTVDIRTAMPEAMFEKLKGVRVGGRRLNISRLSDGASPDDWTNDAPPAPSPAPAPKQQQSKSAEPKATATAPAAAEKTEAKKTKVKPKARGFSAAKPKFKHAGRKRILSSR
jgi:ATP-dependent RNA helicase DeaD